MQTPRVSNETTLEVYDIYMSYCLLIMIGGGCYVIVLLIWGHEDLLMSYTNLCKHK
jgi:hypothetical protein